MAEEYLNITSLFVTVDSETHINYTGFLHFQNDRQQLSLFSSQASVIMPTGLQKAQEELPEADQKQRVPETQGYCTFSGQQEKSFKGEVLKYRVFI